MKNTWYIALLLSLITVAACEDNPVIINMDCALVGDGYDLYLNDAGELTMRHMIAEQLPEIDSTELPQEHIERIHKALIAVYNATDSLDSADEVVNQHMIHAFTFNSTNRMYAIVDDSYAWTQEWAAGNTLTGNPDIDNLVNSYNLTLLGLNYSVAVLVSDNPINMIALANEFQSIDGIQSASPDAIFGDGNDIEMLNYTDDEITLVYSRGWGDCQAGCIYHHYWEFDIDADCIVTFVREFGTPLLY